MLAFLKLKAEVANVTFNLSIGFIMLLMLHPLCEVFGFWGPKHQRGGSLGEAWHSLSLHALLINSLLLFPWELARLAGDRAWRFLKDMDQVWKMVAIHCVMVYFLACNA